MEFKTILAVLQDEADTERVLGMAVALAARHGAHLVGLHARALPLPPATPMGMPDIGYMEAADEASRKLTAKVQAIFEHRTRAEGVSAEWRSMESISGDSAAAALESARCADLVVAGQGDPDQPAADLAALLFHGGRPVLFVPFAGRFEAEFARIIVAWNGTSEAARAAFDALPFLVAARQVEILTVDAPTDARQDAITSGAEIAAALSRHGCKVTVVNVHSGTLTAGEAIQNRVADENVQLLVAGAYSRSRLRELFFGGVTRTMIRSMTCPTLMSR
jgi:nucleotide-binding universal stress UspA family protein